MTTTIQTNSGKKLYEILYPLTQVAPSNPPVLSNALVTYFKEEKLNSNFGYAFSALVKAFEEVREDIENCEQIGPQSKRIYVSALNSLEQIVNPQHFNTNWEQVKQRYLQPQNIDQLHPISDFLEQHRPQKMISPDEINGIREACEELRNTVEEKEGMHEELRQVLLHQLNEIIKAISLYNSFGDTLFKEKAKEVFGDIFTNPIYHATENAEQERDDFFGIIKGMRDAVINTHDITDASIKIAENADKLSLMFGS